MLFTSWLNTIKTIKSIRAFITHVIKRHKIKTETVLYEFIHYTLGRKRFLLFLTIIYVYYKYNWLLISLIFVDFSLNNCYTKQKKTFISELSPR